MTVDPPAGKRLRVELAGVPETTLWTLYHRADEARRGGGVLCDPKAIEVVRAIDFDFRGRFGRSPAAFGRAVALRATAFDAQVRAILEVTPDAIVVALGEGLETQFWRVDNGRVRWFTVELPQTAAVREAVLPSDPPRRRLFAGSALDQGWLDALGEAPGDRVIVVAQGLLMYLPPGHVEALISRCAVRFPGGVMVFDTVPKWFARLARAGRLRGPGGYAAPPMPWGVTPGPLVDRLRLDPHILDARMVDPPAVGGVAAVAALRVRANLPALQRFGPAIVRVDFRTTG
jgi:O-methyltransferase involved in polyketide biosynthesis